jgi:TrmH family RNA methyltransferase
VLDDAAHPRVRGARRLHAAAGRRRTGRFLAEGPQAVAEALAVPGVVVEVFATAERLAADPSLRPAVAGRGLGLHVVSDRVLRTLAETTSPQGVVAVCHDVTVGLTEVLAAQPRLLVVLAGVRDPGNAGTIIRTADAAGADGVLLLTGSVDPLGGKCVRSTVGSLFHLPVSPGHGVDVLDTLRGEGLAVLAADGEGSADLYEVAGTGRLAGPTAWVVGNEAHGLDASVLDRADAVVRVPLFGPAESLNVSVATALCLYASAVAQRRGWAARAPAHAGAVDGAAGSDQPRPGF